MLERQLAYWRRQLAGAPALLDLPTDRPRPAVQTFRGALLPISIDPTLTAALRALSRAEGVTLFMTLLAALQVLLARYSRPERHRRRHADRRTAPAASSRRSSASSSTPWPCAPTSAASPPSASCWRASARPPSAPTPTRTSPSSASSTSSSAERSLSHSPLFQVLLMLQSATNSVFEIEDMQIRSLDLGVTTARFELELNLLESADAVSGALTYNTALFEPGDCRTYARAAA